MAARHEKKPTEHPLTDEQRADAWAAFCQLLHVVALPNYPPKPRPPKDDQEGDQHETE